MGKEPDVIAALAGIPLQQLEQRHGQHLEQHKGSWELRTKQLLRIAMYWWTLCTAATLCYNNTRTLSARAVG